MARQRRAQARVKGCGKSAPASGAIPAAGNPHPEQGRAVGWMARPPEPRFRHPRVGRADGWSPNGTPARDPGTESRLQAGSPTTPLIDEPPLDAPDVDRLRPGRSTRQAFWL